MVLKGLLFVGSPQISGPLNSRPILAAKVTESKCKF